MKQRSTPDEPLHPWFVTGFVDGEGTFTFSRSGSTMNLVFGIKLTASDRPLLERIADFFRVGNLYDVKARAPSTRGTGYTKPAVYYKVTRLADLEQAVIPHFQSFPLQGEKRESFEIWARMVELKSRDFRKPLSDELKGLADLLSAYAPRKQEWKQG